MKKLLILFVSFLLVFNGWVQAEDVKTHERTEENRYGINERYELGEKQKKHALMTPYVDSHEKVYDFASLFTETSLVKLKEEAQGLSKKTNMDVVIVTIDSLGSRTREAYSADFYDYNDFKIDGILFLIAIGDREAQITTSGYGQIVFDKSRTDSMFSSISSILTLGDYSKAADNFLSWVDYYYDEGPTSAMQHCKVLNDMGEYKCYKEVPVFLIFGISLIGCSLITWFIASRYKKIRAAKNADTYVKKEEIKFSDKHDLLIHTSTTRVYSPPSDSSSSSGGGSSFSGSSGSSHGGSGGSF